MWEVFESWLGQEHPAFNLFWFRMFNILMGLFYFFIICIYLYFTHYLFYLFVLPFFLFNYKLLHFHYYCEIFFPFII